MIYYLLVLGATALQAIDFSISKKYQALEGTGLSAGFKFNAIVGLVSAVFAFVLCGFQIKFSWFSLLIALGTSGFGVIYSVLGFRVLKAGNVAVYSTFLMSGGMLLPYLFGLVFLDETVTVLRVLGILLILGAVLLSNRSKERVPMKMLILCICIFLLNGLVSVLSKCHQIGVEFKPVDSTAFVVYSSGVRFVLGLLVLPFVPGKKTPLFTGKLTPWLVVGSGVVCTVSYIFQLIGAVHLPATVLYPMVTGGSIVLSAFAGLAFYREKLSGYQWLSIALSLAGTLCFL